VVSAAGGDLTVVLEPISTDEEMRLADVAGRELETYFAELIEERRRAPQEDLTSALVAVHDDTAGVALTGAELLANWSCCWLPASRPPPTCSAPALDSAGASRPGGPVARRRGPRTGIRRGDPPVRLAGAAHHPVPRPARWSSPTEYGLTTARR
jgi:hypothetical protein